MSDEIKKLIETNKKLLDAISNGDWDAYSALCEPSLTSFEPEARGQLVSGMKFHKFYFDNLSFRSPAYTTMAAPHVRLIGDSVAIVSCVRLTQRINSDNTSTTHRFEETRVWEKKDGAWKHVHFHRSDNGQ